MPDVQLVSLHHPNAQIAAQSSAVVGHPPIFTDYTQILGETRPDSPFRLQNLQNSLVPGGGVRLYFLLPWRYTGAHICLDYIA
jgi:hypothetical protein